MHKAAGHYPERAGDAKSAVPAPAANDERILLLECRLEQLRAALDEARADADKVRVKLAEAAAREADHARRHALVQQELADARAELASLHERLDRSEALRAELEGHLFEAGARGDAAELIRLRREVLAQRQRSIINERTCTRLRARVDELLMSRETLLTRVAEWQRLVQKEGPAAADLAEFMAELRGDILHLEHRNAAGERQEAALRERLIHAGLDPDAPYAARVSRGTDAWHAGDGPAGLELTDELPILDLPALTEADEDQSEESVETPLDIAVDEGDGSDGFAPATPLPVEAAEPADLVDGAAAAEDEVSRASNGLEPDAAEYDDGIVTEPAPDAGAPPVEGLGAADPSTRAAAYERLIRVLEGDPVRLAEQLRPGLADPHPRVRRRAVLAAATAQRLPLRPLLEPLQGDPDPHVRRVVREVLRHARPAERRTGDEDDVALAPAQARPGTRP